MRYNILKLEALGKLGFAGRGIRVNSRDKITNVSDGIGYLTITDVENMADNKETKERWCNINTYKNKYNKDFCYAQKFDILFPTIARKDSRNVFFLNYELQKKCIYNDTIIYFRTSSDIVTAEYIYVILSSQFFSKYISTLSKGTRINGITTKQILENIKIPILNEKARIQLVKEYYELKQKNENFNTKLNDLTTYGNGMNIETV